ARSAAARHLLSEVRPVVDEILETLEVLPEVDRCSVAGSIRRWRETIGDIDVLISTTDAPAVSEALGDLAFVGERLEAGERKASVRTTGGIRADFRFVDPSTYGAALVYFTGSKDHNVQLRQRAIDRGLKVNEYGVFRGEDRLAGGTEAVLYEELDLAWIPPELREARGEVEAAASGGLPDLLTASDLRGDLHAHTDWSDGRSTVEEMVAGAEAFGHDYVAITDHAVGPGVVADAGLDADRLREQAEVVSAVAGDAELEVFHGVEVNIAADGALSLPDGVLEELDLVIASPHAALDQDRETATDRLVRAVEHPAVDVIGHPTGRKLGRREGLPIDVERVAAAAAAAGVALEVNSHPVRLDLAGEAVQTAIATGADVAISTDAHVPREFELLRYGLHTARRGWAEASDVVTTRDAAALREWLH
ncbi:MAG: PHP domain-containing protein, partial [Halobacteriota archaeon]